jgi:ligand-binding sensor domain-containing protein/signal transduction histidine kinase
MKLKSLLLFLLICHAGFSQENYHYEWFSADSNHLPQNSVKSITTDKYGYIWLSTENGIVRYDGQNFKIFNSENIKGLSSNRMLLFTGNIEKDSILILNERGETLLIHQRIVKSIDKRSLPKKLSASISKDIYSIHPAIKYPKKEKPFAVSVKDRTYVFSNDSMSIYNSNYQLAEQQKYTRKDSLRFFVSSGNLYMLNKQNEYALFSEIEESYKKFGPAFTNKIKIYTNAVNQQAFLYSDHKLFYIKEVNGHITTQLIFSDFDCENNNIVSAYFDEKNEILFLGSTNKGLLVIKHKDFNHNSTAYYHSSGTDDVYYALAKYDTNKILASTGEIFGSNGETGLINIGAYTDKYMLVVDNNGDVWTKNDKQLYRFTKKSNFEKSERWVFPHMISTMTRGVNGNIFITTIKETDQKKGFLYTINPTDLHPLPQKLLNLDFPPSTLFDIDGNKLWCGSWKGLYKIDLRTKKTQFIKGTQNATIRSIYAPTETEVWLGTYNNGFYLYRNNKLTHMPKDRNGYLLTTHCIIEDRQGFMWMTTNKGLFVAKKEDLYNYADNKIKRIYYHVYDKNAGFLNNEFNGGCSACGINLDNKAIFFPSMDGVVYFNPDKVKKREPKNDIFLDQTQVDSLTYSSPRGLVFNRNFGKIKFYLSSPFFGNPYNQNIETRLEGPVVQDWTPMTENNVSFSTLPPGEYKLRTRKLTGFGSKYIYKDFKFNITPAFWQTNWFTVLLVLFGLFLAYLFYKLRVRYIKHKNIQLEKQVVLRTQQLQTTVVALRKTKDDLSIQVSNHKNLIKIITHDIKSPLKFIAITGRYIYNNLEKTAAIAKDDIKAIYTSSAQLYHFVDNFLEYAKETDLNNNESQPYSLTTLVNEKVNFFKNIATAAKTTVTNEVDERLFISVNRHLLSIILHNLLDNALKNTFEGTISLNAITEANTLSISIADSGSGMKQEMVDYYMGLAEGKISNTKQKGMGLHMIIELLAIISGTLHITSGENAGTTITLSFTKKD